MFDHLLTEEQKEIREEAREFVKSIPRQMILDMDQDKIKFPREFLQEAGRRPLAEQPPSSTSWSANQKSR